MAFSFPCDLENIDVVLPMRYREKLYVTINDNEKLLNAEGDNGYAYVVAGTTVDNLKKSISHISTDNDELKDDDITEITALELLIRWRSFILDGKPTLVLDVKTTGVTQHYVVLMGCCTHTHTVLFRT